MNDEYEFIDNDGSFNLSDQTPNEAFYVKDKVHLNYLGTDKLIKNLGIEHMTYVIPASRRCQSNRNKNVVLNRPPTCRFNQKIKCGSLGHKSKSRSN